ncbi:plant invertase/pectin methylesterase inhibitor [Striga asiatica]|uniref:Pectinesterase n=1 Tax=Striga asiatica TaxID=4170 RepID=A0A5A7QND8_STRAF|nr:plant invertase/pectin methylesterase inhibitor [Striga asiatica]
MENGSFGNPEPSSLGPSPSRSLAPNQTNKTKRSKTKPILLILAALLVASAACAAAVAAAVRRKGDSGGVSRLQVRRPSKAISVACGLTEYRELCLSSLAEFPAAATASLKEIVHVSVNDTLRRLGRALDAASNISRLDMDNYTRSAIDGCLELLEDSSDQLSRSLNYNGSAQDVMTWLSAGMTNINGCADGLDEVGAGEVKDRMTAELRNLSELVSNCLAMYAVAADFSGVPANSLGRRLMGAAAVAASGGFPAWLSRRDRRLLEKPAAELKVDVVVSPDGNGTCRTIEEAIKKAPENGGRRFIIHVRAGRYDEKILKVGRTKRNLMFIGDGKGKTVITGNKSVADNMTTFHTASFAATGNGLILKDITFENLAGPINHQAVALRIGADYAVIYNCNIIGYQDTLYVHSQRQFYQGCDIYGTIDFIFGNAAVVFQSCNIYARKPLPSQKNTITAQSRQDPNQNTGISIHNCSIMAEPDLMANKNEYPTYLGRPWKSYAQTVYMLCNISDNINPKGWLEWNQSSFALDTLYYGEYKNYGPGAVTMQRVNWTGYHAVMSADEANKFTVDRFLSGSSWLPSTGVAFEGGLGIVN